MAEEKKVMDVLRSALEQWEYRKPALATNAATSGHRAEVDKLVNAITIVLSRLICQPVEKQCEHKNIINGELEGLTEFELCIDCGMSRSVWEQGESNWIYNEDACKNTAQQWRKLQAETDKLKRLLAAYQIKRSVDGSNGRRFDAFVHLHVEEYIKSNDPVLTSGEQISRLYSEDPENFSIAKLIIDAAKMI